MKIHTLGRGKIEKFLRRLMSQGRRLSSPKLDEVLKEILLKADEFLPSEAGSILLDDPYIKSESIGDPFRNQLHFVACFGPASEKILGKTIAASYGVAGKTYIAGRPYMGDGTGKDKDFYDDIDKKMATKTRSILCVPIVLGHSVCGVIELINRKGKKSYSRDEMKLLEIFAGYTSTLIQNALDANRNEELTKRDDLTGLFNDRYFHRQLSEELRKAKRSRRHVSLLFLDLDNFKQVNDNFGHLVGSRALAEVGHLIRDTLEGENAGIVRYGGDEFAIILPGKSRDEAYLLAERVRKAIQHAVFLKEKVRTEQAYNISGVITCSVGIASFFEDGLEGKTLEEEKIAFIRHADKAMYKAKDCGKNSICFGEKQDGPPSAFFSSGGA